MNLLRVGHRILNLDNVALAHLSCPVTPAGDMVRVYWNSPGEAGSLTHTDFKGAEAEMLRAYFGQFSQDATRYLKPPAPYNEQDDSDYQCGKDLYDERTR